MNQVAEVSAAKIAEDLAHIKIVDPGASALKIGDLGSAVRVAELMSKSQGMVPEHLRRQPALCLAVVLRAAQWKFDPYGLAAETYQASPNAIIGYQAKVFAAALRNCAGITLQFEYTGTVTMSDKPATSAKGNQVARRAAVGDRQCRVFATIDGVPLDYTTPKLDDIGIKNSALWHNDPDQQLGYYAVRGWTRRHRPEVMMGAYSVEEAREITDERTVRDVTPKPSGLAALAASARAPETETVTAEDDVDLVDDTDTADAADGADTPEAEVLDPEPEEEEVSLQDQDPEAYADGVAAGQIGTGRDRMPAGLEGMSAVAWLAGYDSVAA